MSIEHLAVFAVALISIVNPFSTLPAFMSLTRPFPPAIQRRAAGLTAITMLVVLLASAWLGELILDLMGVSIGALQAAGGTILLLAGLEMVQAETHDEHKQEIEDARQRQDWKTIAVVPLGIPLTVGGETIAYVIAESSQIKMISDLIWISLICLLVSALTWLLYLAAKPIGERLGHTGMNIVTRVFGVLLLAIGFMLLAEGLKDLLPGLAG